MPSLGNTPRPAYVYDTETDTWVPIGVGAHTHDYIPNTLVDAKGDILTATADNTPAKLSKGADGTVLVSDSTTSTGLAWQPYAAPQVAGKNMVINGAFDFWQRGTSFTTGAFQYSADRWRIGRGAFQTGGTYTRQNANLEGFRYCIRIQRDAGGNGTGGGYLATSFETSESLRFSGKVVTLSFYARKSTNYTGTGISTVLQSGTGTDEIGFAESNFATGASNIFNTSASALTTSWQRFTFTGTVPSNSTQLGIRLVVEYSGVAPADDYAEITGVQLEAGSTATHFSRAAGNLGSELAACQRYYYRLNANQGSSYAVLGTGFATNTTTGAIVINFPTTLRVKPSAIESGGSIRIHDEVNAYAVNSYSYDGNTASTDNIRILVNSGGLTAYRPLFLGGNNSTSAYLAFSAEL